MPETTAQQDAGAGALFGRIASNLGLVSGAAVEECLRIQEEARARGENPPLGRILYERGHLSAACLVDSIIAIQEHLRQTGQEIPLRPWLPQLGQILIEGGHLPAARIEEALAIQDALREQGLPVRLGDLLVERGWTTRATIETALADARTEIERRFGAGRNTRFAALAVKAGLITAQEAEECLEIQAKEREQGIDRPIGRVLYEKGTVDTVQIARHILEIQIALRGLSPAATSESFERAFPPLARALVAKGLVTSDQVREALAIQSGMESQGLVRELQDVLLAQGWVTLQAIEEALGSQEGKPEIELEPGAPADRPDPLAGASPEDWLFAEIAIAAGAVGSIQVRDARAIQDVYARHHVAKTLPDVLEELGHVTREAASRILEKIRGAGAVPERPEPLPRTGGTRTADLVRAKGLVTDKAILDATELQKDLARVGLARSLGALLVEKGALPREAYLAIAELDRTTRSARSPARARTRRWRVAAAVLAGLLPALLLGRYLSLPAPEEPSTPPRVTAASPNGKSALSGHVAPAAVEVVGVSRELLPVKPDPEQDRARESFES
ncbi:MAG: hypothetical protein HY720_27160 [Planctomycetes bacterium]|nr:hypothetical protein [Planctomycetota bacterium]